MTLDGRVALVTGGSRGVGRAIALRLAADGAAIAVNYRRDDAAAEEVLSDIRRIGGRAAAYRAAIDDRPAVQTMVTSIGAELGRVDIVVSNAGTSSRGNAISDTPTAEFESLLAVHALGPLALLQTVLPDLRAATRSDIVMISSATVPTAPANAAPYTMAKSAMETCIRTLAREERRHGVRANIVAPGLVATDMGQRLVKATTGGGLQDLSPSSPFGRVCQPADVAAAVSWLVSADADYVTGQRIGVDGGGDDPSIF